MEEVLERAQAFLVEPRGTTHTGTRHKQIIMIPNFDQLFKQEKAKHLAKQAAKRQAAKEKKLKWKRINRTAKKLWQEAMTSKKNNKEALLEAYHKTKDTKCLGIQALLDQY